MNQIDLKNRKAVVTGGAQGIGLAIAERLLKSGASVSLWDRDESLLMETSDSLTSKGKVEPVVMDVTDFKSVRNASEKQKNCLEPSKFWFVMQALQDRLQKFGNILPRNGSR